MIATIITMLIMVMILLAMIVYIMLTGYTEGLRDSERDDDENETRMYEK